MTGDAEDDGSPAAEPMGTLARDRAALAPVRDALAAVDFYAYGHVDEQNRWTVAADAEEGRVDVRVGSDGFEVILWTSSPGLYADEEEPFRRKALERLARITIPNIARGFLEPHQHAYWDETELGVAVTIRYELPFTRAADVGHFVRGRFDELDRLLGFVEVRVIA
ncbi:MAG: hypothetical protein WKF80_11165 [Thermomicrobiales bacterium]